MDKSVIIIGSGPAGYTAAIYAARAELEPLVLAGVETGGQLMLTNDVENYPGFPTGITGNDLMHALRRQAERFGTQTQSVDVTRVDFSTWPFGVWTDSETYTTGSVIVATGASAVWLGVPGESRLRGLGVSACAVCDGFFFRNKRVIVVGGGDVAMEEALFLSRYAAEVVVVHRRHQLRAGKAMQRRAQSNPTIRFRWDSVVEDVLGDTRVTGVRLRNVKSGEISVLATDGVFVSIGHRPNTELFTGQIALDHMGYITSPNPATAETSVPGVFAAGDVRDHRYRQAVTAAGDGARAAIDAERWLEEHADYRNEKAA